jgi:hypothetical protein
VGTAEDELEQLVWGHLGKFAGLDAGIYGVMADRLGDGNRDRCLADFDDVAIFQVHGGVLAFCAFLRGFAGLASTVFLSVDVSAVQAAEVAEGRLRRTGFQDEVVTGNLGVVREPGMAVRHAAEQKRVVFCESEDFPLGGAFRDREGNCHKDVLRFSEDSVNQREMETRRRRRMDARQ